MTSKDFIPFLAINFLCFLLAWILVRSSRFYNQLSSETSAERVSMIDGLRGWLALGVFFTHAYSMHAWFVQGQWGGAQAGFFGMTGEIGVALFFMITGFLFWGRVLRAETGLNVEALYTRVGRESWKIPRFCFKPLIYRRESENRPPTPQPSAGNPEHSHQNDLCVPSDMAPTQPVFPD